MNGLFSFIHFRYSLKFSSPRKIVCFLKMLPIKFCMLFIKIKNDFSYENLSLFYDDMCKDKNNLWASMFLLFKPMFKTFFIFFLENFIYELFYNYY